MYTTIESWIFTFSSLFLFATLTGFAIARKELVTAYRILLAVTCPAIFFATAVIAVSVVEDTIRSAKKDGVREGVWYQKADQLLINRRALTPGWYEIVERPFAHRLRSEFGDTTAYVTLSVRVDGVEPAFEVVFPLESWKLVPPKPEVKWLGERWTLVSLPDPQPRAVRIERYEGREYGYEPRVVEARF